MDWERDKFWAEEGSSTRDFGTMIRARRKELGLTQKQVGDELRVEGKAIPQSRVADHERGFAPVRVEIIEEFARVLKMSRNLLYLAAQIVPPEVAAELRRLTPEEREMAWRAFTQVVEQSQRKQREEQAQQPSAEAPPKTRPRS